MMIISDYFTKIYDNFNGCFNGRLIDKVIFCKILQFVENGCECYLTNEQFMWLTEAKTEKTVSDSLKRLEKMGLITKVISHITENGKANKRRTISVKKGYKDILAKNAPIKNIVPTDDGPIETKVPNYNGPIKNINGPIENLDGPIENLDGPIEIGGIIDKQVDKEVDKQYIKRSKEEQSSVNTNKPTKKFRKLQDLDTKDLQELLVLLERGSCSYSTLYSRYMLAEGLDWQSKNKIRDILRVRADDLARNRGAYSTVQQRRVY